MCDAISRTVSLEMGLGVSEAQARPNVSLFLLPSDLM